MRATFRQAEIQFAMHWRESMPVMPNALSMEKMAGMAQHASGWDTAGAILLLLGARLLDSTRVG